MDVNLTISASGAIPAAAAAGLKAQVEGLEAFLKDVGLTDAKVGLRVRPRDGDVEEAAGTEEPAAGEPSA